MAFTFLLYEHKHNKYNIMQLITLIAYALISKTTLITKIINNIHYTYIQIYNVHNFFFNDEDIKIVFIPVHRYTYTVYTI